MRIEIYGKTQCPYCDMAKRLAQRIVEESSQQNHTYNYYQLDQDFNREEILEKFPGARTFPQIMIDGTKIGGYTEFEAWYND
jgi:glutaredoxin